MDHSFRYVFMKRSYPLLYKLSFFGLLLLLLLLGLPALAEVNARLSRSTTSLDEPVRLRLEIKGENDASPDLSVLNKDFEILGRSQQQNISIINGQMSKTHGLSLTLLPKKLGTLNIPPIQVGSEHSSPLTLEVVEALEQTDDATESGAFIQLEVDKAEAYLQEEVILTLRLYMAEGVRGESLSEPQPSLQDTIVRLLNEEQYQAEYEGQTYRVVERRYAIYAYQTGQLKLGGTSFRGRTGGSSSQSIFNLLREPFNNPARERRIVRAKSEQVQLSILPVPAKFSGKRWLPARNLQIVESGLNSAGPLTAGKPATRNIMLFADGLTAAQLPPIEFELPVGVKQYPERPQNRDNVSREGISGSRQSAITLVATDPDSYDLPAIEIPWWNTETDRQEVARLPAIVLQVLPGLPGSLPAVDPQSFTETFEETEAPATELDEQPETIKQDEKTLFNWLVWLLLAGWLITLIGWWFSSRLKKQPPTIPTPSQEREEQPKDELAEILTAMDIAYREMDRESARMAWLRWGEYRWPKSPPSNLNRLAERCPQNIAVAVNALDRAIYSPSNREDWGRFSPRELLNTDKQERQRTFKREKLIPLNP